MDKYSQSYSQAPWRRQLQFIGLFSLVLVFAALVAGIFLNISARAAAVGRNIQDMQRKIETLDREIEDLQAQLALAQSVEVMERRASDMGFSPFQGEQIVYLKVQGYVEPQPVVLAPYQGRAVPSAPVLPSTYTESLMTWFRRLIASASIFSLEVVP